ncbi:class I SAM-dependent methyltransferase [Chitinibacter sp. SCUT-21]|uniref:class I SAM-dependent methyltransferase n=1 Tax=Chitinibacter sp. SCUT-21 TaxID=2970891 RepID=UPI0035A5B5E3
MLQQFKPWLRFTITQCVGGAIFCALALKLPLIFSLLFSALFCFAVARFIHPERWWPWIHFSFLPVVFLALQLDIPNYYYLLAFLVTWVVFGRVALSRVPLFLTEKEALDILAANIKPNSKFLDVGAGTGRVLNYLSRVRPDLQLCGVEQAFLPWVYGRLLLDKKVKWIHGDYRDIHFANYDCIYAYLSPAVMSQLWAKAKSELPPGATLISNSFEILEHKPNLEIDLHDWKTGKLLIWQM